MSNGDDSKKSAPSLTKDKPELSYREQQRRSAQEFADLIGSPQLFVQLPNGDCCTMSQWLFDTFPAPRTILEVFYPTP